VRSCNGLFKLERRDGKWRRHRRKPIDRRASVTPVRNNGFVENRENGRSAVVRIADRGPHVGGRIIDVSQAAAHELGFADLTRCASRSCRFRKIEQPVKIDCCDRGNSSAVAITRAVQSSSWVAHRLTRINDILERLAGLPCCQPPTPEQSDQSRSAAWPSNRSNSLGFSLIFIFCPTSFHSEIQETQERIRRSGE
jgi:hypothetical protein